MAGVGKLDLQQVTPITHGQVVGAPVLRQVGWIGTSGTVYQLGGRPQDSEPGGFRPLYIQIGTWVDTDGTIAISD